MFKVIFNLAIGYIVYLYAIRPFIRGFLGIDDRDNFQQSSPNRPTSATPNKEYTDFEEV